MTRRIEDCDMYPVNDPRDEEPDPNDTGEPCELCGTFVHGFEYQGCCDGRECGCMGRPVEPCVCSDVCWDKLINGRK